MINNSELNEKIAQAIEDLKAGKVILVSDDENRENEGDLIASAQTISYDSLNLMATEARGLICAPLSPQIASQFNLPQMTAHNSDSLGTAFTVSLDEMTETTTGISIGDRLATLRRLSDKEGTPAHFKHPGHIFPLEAKAGGLFERTGHTEAAVELMKIANLSQAAVICEMLNKDGTMARMPELKRAAKKHKLTFITIEELIHWQKLQSDFVTREAETLMPTDFGNFKMIGYNNREDNREHFALVCGNLDNFSEAPLVRVHSECLTGDLLGSRRCDCGNQLQQAMKRISEKGEGVVIYLRQEGRGIGLFNKLKAYELQDNGMDTVDANHELGFKSDLRDYGTAAGILRDLGINKVQLMTNNPLKIEGLKKFDIDVIERVHHECDPTSHNRFYLETKKKRMGHILKKV